MEKNNTIDYAQQLWEIEQIKILKARYFRLMDFKEWDEWADLFTEDCIMDNSTNDKMVGREAIKSVGNTLAEILTVHHGHMPDIELTSPTTAKGVWAMEDRLTIPDPENSDDLNKAALMPYILWGFGYYFEDYIKCDDGKWRIKSTTLKRLLSFV
jgi:hypothetical protein